MKKGRENRRRAEEQESPMDEGMFQSTANVGGLDQPMGALFGPHAAS